MERLKVEREHENSWRTWGTSSSPTSGAEEDGLSRFSLRCTTPRQFSRTSSTAHSPPSTTWYIISFVDNTLRIAVFWSHFAFISDHGALRTCKPLGVQRQGRAGVVKKKSFCQGVWAFKLFQLLEAFVNSAYIRVIVWGVLRVFWPEFVRSDVEGGIEACDERWWADWRGGGIVSLIAPFSLLSVCWQQGLDCSWSSNAETGMGELSVWRPHSLHTV